MKKETKQDIKRYVFSSITLLIFSLLFSLFSLIFIIDKIPKWLQFVVSFVFIAPTFYIAFAQGRTQGERLFKAKAKTTLTDLHSEEGLNIPYYKCVFHVLGFVVPIWILFILAVILKSPGVRLAGMLFEFPAALMFSSVGILDLQKVTPMSLAIFLPYALLEAGMFVLGYLLKIYRLKQQHADIKGELRTFDN